jgi:azurin
MKCYKLKAAFLMLTVIFVSLVSCKESSKSEASEKEMTSVALESLSKQDTINITLNSNDKMQFDQTEITVFEGQTVILTLNHTGTMPVTAMGHNFVLLSKGTSISAFAQLVVNEKENEYIPTDLKNVIAHTALIGGGENTAVTFKAPEKGTYDYLCSFPGHYSIMKGKFHVK